MPVSRRRAPARTGSPSAATPEPSPTRTDSRGNRPPDHIGAHGRHTASVETARHVLGYTGGTLVMPMTVLVEQYWREISTGLAHHAIPVRHFVLHADQDTLRGRIEGDTPVPSPFRLQYLEPYAEAARTWLHGEAEVVDTTHLTPAQVARQIAQAVKG